MNRIEYLYALSEASEGITFRDFVDVFKQAKKLKGNPDQLKERDAILKEWRNLAISIIPDVMGAIPGPVGTAGDILGVVSAVWRKDWPDAVASALSVLPMADVATKPVKLGYKARQFHKLKKRFNALQASSKVEKTVNSAKRKGELADKTKEVVATEIARKPPTTQDIVHGAANQNRQDANGNRDARKTLQTQSSRQKSDALKRVLRDRIEYEFNGKRRKILVATAYNKRDHPAHRDAVEYVRSKLNQ